MNNLITLLPANDSRLNSSHIRRALEIAESVFETHSDPFQIDIGEKNVQWTIQTIPYCWILILVDGECVGSASVLPTSEESRLQFLSGAISENTLIERVQESTYKMSSSTSLYLAGVTILPEFQRQHLGSRALMYAIESARKNLPQPQTLFCWLYTEAGSALIRRLQERENMAIQTLNK